MEYVYWTAQHVLLWDTGFVFVCFSEIKGTCTLAIQFLETNESDLVFYWNKMVLYLSFLCLFEQTLHLTIFDIYLPPYAALKLCAGKLFCASLHHLTKVVPLPHFYSCVILSLDTTIKSKFFQE